MQNSKDYKPNQSRGVLIIGQPGSGKTTLALQTFPSVWIGDCDNNLSGAERFLRDKISFAYDTIDVLPDGSEVPLDARFKRLSDCIREASTNASIKSLGIDSFTKMSDYVMDDLLKKQGRTVMQLQDWGVYLGTMKATIVRMRSTRKLFFATAHIKPEKDEVSGIVRYFPALPGQIQHIIGALFSDVWLCQVIERGGQHQFVVKTMPDTFYPLKNSLGLPAVATAEQIREALAKEGAHNA